MFPNFVGHTGNVRRQLILCVIGQRRSESRKISHYDCTVSFRTRPDAYRDKSNVNLPKVSPIRPRRFVWSGNWARNGHTGNVNSQVILWIIWKNRYDSQKLHYDDCAASFRTKPDSYRDKWSVQLPKLSIRLVEKTTPVIDGNLSDLSWVSDDFHTDVSKIRIGGELPRRFIWSEKWRRHGIRHKILYMTKKMTKVYHTRYENSHSRLTYNEEQSNTWDIVTTSTGGKLGKPKTYDLRQPFHGNPD